ncbi:response regulator receiver protein [Mesorhizobium sp. M0768]|uniref:phosphorylase family protein n=1 Tax=Mesorhizobium sp. M0768 TaxID=2956996 RepID=UPI0033360D25
MRTVVFEDDNDKYASIAKVLIAKGVKENAIKRIDNIAKFVAIAKEDFDLCVIDLLMPTIPKGGATSSGMEILHMLDYAGKKRVPLLAITSFVDEAEKYRDAFAARGCIIYDFNRTETWTAALDVFLAQARDRGRYDFVIFTSISEERTAYLRLPGFKHESLLRYGVDHWDLTLGSADGTVILLQRMGLVNASVEIARVLELYAPRIVAMSGICGGVAGNSVLGQLLVAERCWEYQSGKWYDDAFKAEPYHSVMPGRTGTVLAKMIEGPDVVTQFEAGFPGTVRPRTITQPRIAPFASGSAVIASEKRLRSVSDQHRKVAAIDMETFGLYRAVEMSGRDVHSFCAKTVVDMANVAKDDELHFYGSYLSAKFTLAAVENLVTEKRH